MLNQRILHDQPIADRLGSSVDNFLTASTFASTFLIPAWVLSVEILPVLAATFFVPVALMCPAVGGLLLLDRYAINQVRKRSYSIILVNSENDQKSYLDQGMVCVFKNEQEHSYTLSYKTNSGEHISWQVDAGSHQAASISRASRANLILDQEQVVNASHSLLNVITARSSAISKFQRTATLNRAAKATCIGVLVSVFILGITFGFVFPHVSLFIISAISASTFIANFAGGLIGGLTTKLSVGKDSQVPSHLFRSTQNPSSNTVGGDN